MFVILILHALILRCGDNIEILPNPTDMYIEIPRSSVFPSFCILKFVFKLCNGLVGCIGSLEVLSAIPII